MICYYIWVDYGGMGGVWSGKYMGGEGDDEKGGGGGKLGVI